MASLTEALGGAVSVEELTSLTDFLALSLIAKGAEAVSSPGAAGVTTGSTQLTTDGTDAVSLADGTLVGQRKSIVITVGSTTPVAVVTPANYADGTTATLTGEGASVTLEWDGTNWFTVSGSDLTIG